LKYEYKRGGEKNDYHRHNTLLAFYFGTFALFITLNLIQEGTYNSWKIPIILILSGLVYLLWKRKRLKLFLNIFVFITFEQCKDVKLIIQCAFAYYF
jgi:hypothetical protein